MIECTHNISHHIYTLYYGILLCCVYECVYMPVIIIDTSSRIYRTVGVVNHLEARSVTCDNAQLPMLSEPCSYWPVAASVGSGH